MQFGAAGIHSDVLVQIRWADELRLKPLSHSYVAEALNEVFPCIPPVNDILALSGGEMIPQSEINIKLKTKKMLEIIIKIKTFCLQMYDQTKFTLCGSTNNTRDL